MCTTCIPSFLGGSGEGIRSRTEVKMIVSHQVGVGLKPESSARATHALNHRTTSPIEIS